MNKTEIKRRGHLFNVVLRFGIRTEVFQIIDIDEACARAKAQMIMFERTGKIYPLSFFRI